MVLVVIVASYGIGHLLGLPDRMARIGWPAEIRSAGNSAIGAVAPVIGADGEDVSTSIAFTAVLGLIVVLTLPLTPALLHFSGLQYGMLAGLTFDGARQVLAATSPLGSVAVQMGTGGHEP